MKCLICGTNRYVEECHIKPRRLGGKKTMFLCPNHHKFYDNHLLNTDEIERLPPEAYRYYTKRKKSHRPASFGLMEDLLGPTTERQRGIYELIDSMVNDISIGLGGDQNGREQ